MDSMMATAPLGTGVHAPTVRVSGALPSSSETKVQTNKFQQLSAEEEAAVARLTQLDESITPIKALRAFLML